MNKFQLIDPYNDARWDDFVGEHPLGWVCHLSGWKKVLESSFKHIRGYYFAIIDDSTRRIQAGLPVFHVKSWLLGDRLVSVPFATLCDPLVDSMSQFDILFEAVEKLGRDLKVKQIEIRSFAAESFIKTDQLRKVNMFKYHYLELNDEPSNLLKKFHKSCIVNKIRKAEKLHLGFGEVESQTDLNEFYRLHKLTRKRLGLPVQPYSLFLNLWKVFGPSKRIKILIVKHDKVVIGAMLNFLFKNRMSNDYASTDFNSKSLSPTHFMYWESIKLAHSKGIKIFDFGRTPISAESLATFKSRWGAKTVLLAQHYYSKNGNSLLAASENSLKYKFLQNLCKYSPEHAYNLLSKFVYRHMG
jgi:CelD/BcsL family acetyltransferase involved in cellulose biosynthesis